MSILPFGRAIVMVGMVAGVSTVAVSADSEPAAIPADDIAYETWLTRPGQSLGDIDVGELPDSTSQLGGGFESPHNAGNEYGVRLRTLFTPAESGTYRFFLSSDDDSRLFVNPAGTDPGGVELAAFVAGWTTPYQWDRFASQQSRTYELAAGTPYYLEAIGKEGEGDDHLAVAVQLDGGDIELISSELIEATTLGAGGWRSMSPYGLDTHPVSTDDAGWTVENSPHMLDISWSAVDDATGYHVRLEGSGEVRAVDTEAVSATFDNLVPLSRYLVEVTPVGDLGAMAPRTAVFFTDVDEYPIPVAPTPEPGGGGVSFDRWDFGWWTLTSIAEGTPPVETTTLTTGMQAPVDLGANNGKRIRALLTPSVTADYTFYLASDDDGRLLLNPTGSTVDGARPIAWVSGWTEQYQWDRHRSQRSEVFHLEAGASYYIEAISVQGLDVEHMEVGWSRPGADITVISNDVLSPTDEGDGGWRAGPVVIVDSHSPTPETTTTLPETTTTLPETTTTVAETTTTLPETTTTLPETTTTVPETTTTVPETTTTVPETTTTVPQEEQLPTAAPEFTGEVDMSSYGLLALGTGNCSSIEMSASRITTGGSMHSNADINIWGGNVAINGAVTYGGNTNLVGSNIVRDVSPVAFDPGFDLASLASGLAGYPTPIVHLNGFQTSSAVPDGFHYVVGNVTISGSSIDLRGVTIVATGKINISGSSIKMSPAAAGLPTLMAGSDACQQAAINLSSSTLEWTGTIVSLRGMVRVSASDVTGGDIIAAAIRGSSSNLTFD